MNKNGSWKKKWSKTLNNFKKTNIKQQQFQQQQQQYQQQKNIHQAKKIVYEEQPDSKTEQD